MLKPNMNELRELAGHEITEESQQESTAKEIIEKGQSEVVVVSLGAAGALKVSREGHARFRAPSIPVKSKMGAGESMLAGIVLSLAQGKSLREAVRFGVAAGSSAVMIPGSRLCQRETTERLYNLLLSEQKAEGIRFEN
jgi:6-phosphofructokinase 2